MAPKGMGTLNSRERNRTSRRAAAETKVASGRGPQSKNETYNLLAEEVDQLATAIKAGSLNQRIPEQQFEGRDLETARTLNQMLDAITVPLTEVKTVLSRLAMNDLSVSVAGTFPGAFGEIAAATNLAQERVKNSVRILGNIAAGDFKKDLDDVSKIQRRSENDILVPAFIRAMEAINALVGTRRCCRQQRWKAIWPPGRTQRATLEIFSASSKI